MCNWRRGTPGTRERKIELWAKKKVRVGIQDPACPLGPQQSPRPPEWRDREWRQAGNGKGHLLSGALKAAVRLERGHTAGQRRQRGGWHKGRVREWRTRRLDSVLSEATLHSEGLKVRSRQKWSESDVGGKWEDPRGEDETGLTLSSVVATNYMWLFTFK